MSKKTKRPPQKPAPKASGKPASGRPAGTPNKSYREVVADVSRCPSCGSTERTPYTDRQELEYEGERDGKSYNRVIWRTCSCAACGQHRKDKSFELLKKKPAK